MTSGLLAVTNTVHLTAQTRVVGALIAGAFFLVLLEMVRRHRLEERYTIAWFAAGLALIVMVAVPDTITWLARALGVSDTNVALFALALLACFGLLLHLTVVVSRLAAQSTRLAQELALERANRQAEERAVKDAVAFTAGVTVGDGDGDLPVEQSVARATDDRLAVEHRAEVDGPRD